LLDSLLQERVVGPLKVQNLFVERSPGSI